jgi:hypothetical protein
MKPFYWVYLVWVMFLLLACAPSTPDATAPSPSDSTSSAAEATATEAAPTLPTSIHSPFKGQVESFQMEAEVVSSESDDEGEVFTSTTQLRGHYGMSPKVIWLEAGGIDEMGEGVPMTPAILYADGVYYQVMQEDVWWGMEVPEEFVRLDAHTPLLMNQIESVRDALELIGHEEMHGYPTVNLRANLDVVQQMFDQEAVEFDSPELDTGQIDLWVRTEDNTIVRWQHDVGGLGFNAYYLMGIRGQETGTVDFTALDEPLVDLMPPGAIVFPEGSDLSQMDSSSGKRQHLVATTLSIEEATTLVQEGLRKQGFEQAGEASADGEFVFARGDTQLYVTIKEGSTEEYSTLLTFASEPAP